MPDKQKKTFDEIYKAVLSVLPNAQLAEDNCGQLVVYTNQYPDVRFIEGVYADFEDLGDGQKHTIADGGYMRDDECEN